MIYSSRLTYPIYFDHVNIMLSLLIHKQFTQLSRNSIVAANIFHLLLLYQAGTSTILLLFRRAYDHRACIQQKAYLLATYGRLLVIILIITQQFVLVSRQLCSIAAEFAAIQQYSIQLIDEEILQGSIIDTMVLTHSMKHQTF